MIKSVFPLLIVFLLNSSCIASDTGQLEKVETSDFLIDHIPIYILLILCLFLLQILVLVSFGQHLISPNGIRFWWGDPHSPENSQHLTDWHTFSHIVHGFLIYLLTLLLLPNPPISVNYAYLISLGTAVIWEIVENTPCVINRFRKTGASSEYRGDTVINSCCDSIAMSVGFWVAYLIPWWLTLGLALGEEVLLGLVIRDNMIINGVQVLHPFKCVSDWQAGGKGENGVKSVDQVADEGV